jgi:hypothetical protein
LHKIGERKLYTKGATTHKKYNSKEHTKENTSMENKKNIKRIFKKHPVL